MHLNPSKSVFLHINQIILSILYAKMTNQYKCYRSNHLMVLMIMWGGGLCQLICAALEMQLNIVADIKYVGYNPHVSKFEKLKKRFLSKPKDFTFDELVTLLAGLGYSLSNKGKTSGSAVEFSNGNQVIRIHKPHPGNELKYYQIVSIADFLNEELK